MKKSFLIILLVSCFHLIAEEIEYKLTEGNDTRFVQFQSLQTDNLLIYTYRDGTNRQISYYNDDNLTEKFVLIDSTQKTHITVSKQNDKILVRGNSEGKEIEKEYDLGDVPWQQSMSYSLGKFVQSGEEEIVFWIFRIDDLSMFKIRANKLDQEEIFIQKEKYKTCKVEIEPVGFFSIFWKGHYWFRSSDGLFVKFEGGGNIPGIEKRILEVWR